MQIVKFSSSCLDDECTLRQRTQEIIEYDIKNNTQTAIVTSGSIKLGKRALGVTKKNDKLSNDELQMLARIGQPYLIEIYRRVLTPCNVSQLLLTYDDFDKHPMSICKAIRFDTSRGIYTLINYNDGTDFREAKLNNDVPSADLLKYCSADRLIMLGKCSGFEVNGKIVQEVNEITEDLYTHCNGSCDDRRGGFKAKLDAAKIVIFEGKDMVVAGFDNSIEDIIRGNVQRTLFRGKYLNNKELE